MPSSKPRRIAFTNFCTHEWIAGCHYLKNLFMALKMQENAPELVLLNIGTVSDDYKALLPYVSEVLTYPRQRPLLDRARYALQTRIGANLGGESPMSALLREAQVDVLFAMKSIDKALSIPSLVWIPDFQHLHLPHTFTAEERDNRTKRFTQWAQEAAAVVLSSQNALEDFRLFAPNAAHKGRVLNFVAHVDAKVYEEDPALICREYHLPEKFFYLPNQFWQHKNHNVVIEALEQLRDTHPEIVIVCTGNPHDYRQPRYFSDLLEKVARIGVYQQFLILGMIPHAHIFSLIRQSVAVLQPSLFEGWSTTVEETKSIGKAMILSDIAVHREQNPAQAHYFNPQNPSDLASKLVEAYETWPGGPDLPLEAQARANLETRTQAFGAQFLAIVEEALSN